MKVETFRIDYLIRATGRALERQVRGLQNCARLGLRFTVWSEVLAIRVLVLVLYGRGELGSKHQIFIIYAPET